LNLNFTLNIFKNFKNCVKQKKVFKYVNCRNLIKNTGKLTKKGKYDHHYELNMQKNDQKIKKSKIYRTIVS